MSETESSRELFYSVFVLVSYLASLIGFGIFYWRQERKSLPWWLWWWLRSLLG
jgi:hypothetical protein